MELKVITNCDYVITNGLVMKFYRIIKYCGHIIIYGSHVIIYVGHVILKDDCFMVHSYNRNNTPGR